MKHRNFIATCVFIGGFSSVSGCGTETGGGGGDDTTASSTKTSSGAGTAKCYNVPVNTSTPGDTACSQNVCPGGKYCLGAGICDPGCKSELNCPNGQYCDTSANPDVGLCRAPAASMEVPCMGQTTAQTTATTGGMDCVSRCVAKGLSCGAPPTMLMTGCQGLCPMVSEMQISCLEALTCAEVEQLLEGQNMCGIGM